MNFQKRLANLLLCDLRSTEVIVALAGIFASITFFRIHLEHLANVSLYLLALKNVLPIWVWGLMFFIYSSIRFITSLQYSIGVIKCFAAIVGMVLWSSVFAAGTILPEAPSGLAILYAIPAGFEIWALGQSLAMRVQRE